MGSRRSLLLTEWNDFTYGLITVNYRQRDEFAGGQLNPTHGFSERLARVLVLCRAPRWHFSPPQRTPVPKAARPLGSLCGEASSKWQQGSCMASQPAVWTWCSGRSMERNLRTLPIFPIFGLRDIRNILLISELGGWCPLWLLSSLSLWKVWAWANISSGKLLCLLFYIHSALLIPSTSPCHRGYTQEASFILVASPWLSPDGKCVCVQSPQQTWETTSGQWRAAEDVLSLHDLHPVFEIVFLQWQTETNKQSSRGNGMQCSNTLLNFNVL